MQSTLLTQPWKTPRRIFYQYTVAKQNHNAPAGTFQAVKMTSPTALEIEPYGNGPCCSEIHVECEAREQRIAYTERRSDSAKLVDLRNTEAAIGNRFDPEQEGCSGFVDADVPE